MLGDICQQLAKSEVRGRLDRNGQPITQVGVDRDVKGAVEGQRPHRIRQTAIDEDRGMDPSHQVAQFSERLGRGLPGIDHEFAGGRWVALEELLHGPERHAHGDQSRLCPVVEVAFDPSDLLGLVVDHLAAALGQLRDLPGEFGPAARGQQPPGESAVGGEEGRSPGEAGEDERHPERDARPLGFKRSRFVSAGRRVPMTARRPVSN